MPNDLVDVFNPVRITPPVALAVDFIATWITQTGYLWMKFGQISKEDAPTKRGHSPSFRESGFCTWKWLFGFALGIVGALLHASKFTPDSLSHICLFASDASFRRHRAADVQFSDGDSCQLRSRNLSLGREIHLEIRHDSPSPHHLRWHSYRRPGKR